MELRRHGNIIGFRHGRQAPLAFHAQNMELAEISEDAWEAMVPTRLDQSHPVTMSVVQSEAAKEIAGWNEYQNPETQDLESSFGVRSLVLNVTQICNLHCTYCAAGGDGTYGDPVQRISIENTLPQIRFFMEQIPAGGRFHIAFLGGEPLLYPDALRAIGLYTRDLGKERGITTTFKVTTNGTRINEASLRALTDLRSNVIVSIDGPREIHDLQRKTKSGEGSFDQVIAGIENLIAHKNSLGAIGVHAVFNEKNLDMEKAWDFLSSLDVDSMEFTYTVEHGDRESTRLFNESLARAAEKAWNKGGETELLRIANFRTHFDRLDRRERLHNHCGMGKSMLVVDSRNRLWTCPWQVGQTGNRLGEDSTPDYDALETHRESLVRRNDCGDCWARFLCGGGCSFVHGTTSRKEALDKKIDFCERTRFLLGLVMMYYHRARRGQTA